MKPLFTALAALLALAAAPSLDPASAVRAKFRLIQSGKARRGSVISFTAAELNAFVIDEAPKEVPEGVRNPRLELSTGRASGYALIDFLKLRHARGVNTPWLIARMIEGEKPVKVDARFQSASGQATVFLERVEISGLAIHGSTLDFFVNTFFLPLYPNAKINRPFELSPGVERLEVAPGVARVVMRK